MKTSFAFWILMGVAVGTMLGLILTNIVAGVSCCCAIGNLPVLFMKRNEKQEHGHIKKLEK